MENNNYKVGIVADDITGANDIAIMYSSNGLKGNIFSYASANMGKFQGDVAIIDTDSRFASLEDSYNRVCNATKELMNLGVKYFFKKTCSVFRGNIGIEFDAMLDALHEEFAVVVLGYPDNGRTTINSLHYVRGTLLEESEFKNDPMNPMTESNLVDILQKQTKRKVGSLHFDMIDKGSKNIQEELKKLSKEYNYIIVDVRDNRDLEIIAEAIKDSKVVCGASAVGKKLGKYISSFSRTELKTPPKIPGIGILSISGSITPQTKSQIEYSKIHGIHVIEMDTISLIKENVNDIIDEISKEAIKYIQQGEDVLVYAANDSNIVKRTKEFGRSLGMTETDVAKLVSTSLSKICKNVTKATGQNRVLVAGGDTSGSFCSTYGIDGMTVFKEISSGLPSCISLLEPAMFMILKSGSFGSESFFIDAYNHLKQY